MVKTDVIGAGWKVSISIEGDRVRILIDDRTMVGSTGVSGVDMYHGDKCLRLATDYTIATQHIIREV